MVSDDEHPAVPVHTYGFTWWPAVWVHFSAMPMHVLVFCQDFAFSGGKPRLTHITRTYSYGHKEPLNPVLPTVPEETFNPLPGEPEETCPATVNTLLRVDKPNDDCYSDFGGDASSTTAPSVSSQHSTNTTWTTSSCAVSSIVLMSSDHSSIASSWNVVESSDGWQSCPESSVDPSEYTRVDELDGLEIIEF